MSKEITPEDIIKAFEELPKEPKWKEITLSAEQYKLWKEIGWITEDNKVERKERDEYYKEYIEEMVKTYNRPKSASQIDEYKRAESKCMETRNLTTNV
jgi:hypothetical protein